jgi:hypothetical protein
MKPVDISDAFVAGVCYWEITNVSFVYLRMAVSPRQRFTMGLPVFGKRLGSNNGRNPD